MFTWAGQPSLLCCLWGRSQRGNSAACLLFSSTLSNELLCENGSFSYPCNHGSPQPPLSPLKSAPPEQAAELSSAPSLAPEVHQYAAVFLTRPAQSTTLWVWLFWLIFFFNSLVVRVSCSLIFWRFWLFINFRLVVIFLLVVQESEGSLSTPPSWPERNISISKVNG